MKESKSGGSNKSPKPKKEQAVKPGQAAPSKQAASEQGSGAKK